VKRNARAERGRGNAESREGYAINELKESTCNSVASGPDPPAYTHLLPPPALACDAPPQAPARARVYITSATRSFSKTRCFPASLYSHEYGVTLEELNAKCDPKYADRLDRLCWQRSTHGYARHCWSERGQVFWESMHRLVWKWEYGSVPPMLDHINGDKMDNRIANLRPATPALNSRNARRRSRDLPEGVHRQKSSLNPYWSSTTHAGKKIHLGSFPTPEEAGAAYRAANESIMAYEAALARGEAVEFPVLAVVAGVPGRPMISGDARYLQMHLAGKSNAEIARETGISPETVRRILRDDFGISRKRGRPKKVAAVSP